MTADSVSAPIGIHVPMPPSANRLWRNVPGRRKPILDTAYVAWKADAGWAAKRQIVGYPRIDCRFDVYIEIPPSRGDVDNRVKPLLDLIQSIGLVSNDGNARKVSIEAIEGRGDCLMWITPVPEASRIKKPARIKLYTTIRKPRATREQIRRFEAMRKLP